MKKIVDYRLSPRAVKFYIDRAVSAKTESLGISASVAQFLFAIRDNEGITLSALSMILGVDKSLTTRSVKKLIEMGYVEDTCEGSHRYGVKLTAEGRVKTAEVKKIVDGVWENLLRDVTPEEKKVFKTVSEKVYKVINEELSKGENR